MRITNNHSTPLGLPNGFTLAAGAADDVPDWDKIKDNAVVRAWLKAGILSENDEGPILGARGSVIGGYIGGSGGAELGSVIGTAIGGAYSESRQVLPGPSIDDGRSDAQTAPVDKDELLAKLAAFGLTPDKRTGIPKLQEMLAEAEEKNKSKMAILHGSDTLPANIDIAAGKTVQLGTIVAAAHTASGLTEEAWNALPNDERDSLLNAEIERMKASEG